LIRAALVLAAGLAFASPVDAKGRHPRVQTGTASYYAEFHQGMKQANGRPFDMNKLTMASRTLPLGARARVTNLRNRRHTLVTVTDRGPYVGRRIADLSRRAARDLGMLQAGLAPVKIQIIR
jgi:rare lipoprotein A